MHNFSKKWSQEEAEAFIKEGSVVPDPELFVENLLEPRTDTQGSGKRSDACRWIWICI